MRPTSATPGAGRSSVNDYRTVMACWPTGVAVVTSTFGATQVGCTVTSVTSVSLDPPLLLVSLGRRSGTLDTIRASGRFGLTMLAVDQDPLAHRFATGDPSTRFATVAYQSVAGMPILAGAVAACVCVVERLIPVADHVLTIGRAIWLTRPSSGAPMVRFRHAYRRLDPGADPH